MLCKGSPELGKSAGKGSPELGASGRGTLFMCRETCLSAVPSAGKGSPESEASDKGKQAVCQEYQSHPVTLACVDCDSYQSRLGLTYESAQRF